MYLRQSDPPPPPLPLSDSSATPRREIPLVSLVDGYQVELIRSLFPSPSLFLPHFLSFSFSPSPGHRRFVEPSREKWSRRSSGGAFITINAFVPRYRVQYDIKLFPKERQRGGGRGGEGERGKTRESAGIKRERMEMKIPARSPTFFPFLIRCIFVDVRRVRGNRSPRRRCRRRRCATFQ